MTQTNIPFHFMRGGTSRGPYFKRADLPQDQETLAQVLIAAVGSGHSLNIDGIGGGNARPWSLDQRGPRPPTCEFRPPKLGHWPGVTVLDDAAPHSISSPPEPRQWSEHRKRHRAPRCRERPPRGGGHVTVDQLGRSHKTTAFGLVFGLRGYIGTAAHARTCKSTSADLDGRMGARCTFS